MKSCAVSAFVCKAAFTQAGVLRRLIHTAGGSNYHFQAKRTLAPRQSQFCSFFSDQLGSSAFFFLNRVLRGTLVTATLVSRFISLIKKFRSSHPWGPAG